jgi:ketosteroid isomerase-like protein
MKTKVIIPASMFVFSLIFIQSCKEDKEESSPEFVASSSDFSDFRSWTLVTTHQGPSASLGEAHQGNNADATRTVYFKNNQERASDGRFPVGTLVVKETRDAAGNTIEVTAMVKRGNNFNPDHNDWEWFMLNADGTIKMDAGMTMRGANLMDGMCGACHTQVKSEDFIFSK